MNTWWRVIFEKLLGKKRVFSPLDMEAIFVGSGFTAAKVQAYHWYPAPLPPNTEIGAYLAHFLVSEDSMERLTLALSQIGYLARPELDT